MNTNRTATRNLPRRSLRVALATGALAASGLALVPPANAVTATVPNYFYCSTQTGKCRQVNGPYNASVPTYCKWVFNTYWTGTSTRICDKWVR